jgi:hypothetical protein
VASRRLLGIRRLANPAGAGLVDNVSAKGLLRTLGKSQAGEAQDHGQRKSSHHLSLHVLIILSITFILHVLGLSPGGVS